MGLASPGTQQMDCYPGYHGSPPTLDRVHEEMEVSPVLGVSEVTEGSCTHMGVGNEDGTSSR